MGSSLGGGGTELDFTIIHAQLASIIERSTSHPAAIDRDDGAVDIIGCVRNQEQRGVRDCLGFAGAFAQRHVRKRALQSPLIELLQHLASVDVVFYGASATGVSANVRKSPLLNSRHSCASLLPSPAC